MFINKRLALSGDAPKLNSSLHFALPPAEIVLWETLQARSPKGIRFTRQKIVGDHIVDLYCISLHLAVEITNGSDNTDEDLRRRTFLQDKGATTVFVSAYDVYNRVDDVVDEILTACRAAQGQA